MIQTVDLCKSFETAGGTLQVLKGIHLEIAKGEMVSLVGASGAGKSTLLHLLGALDRPTSGRVVFDGIDLFSQSDAKLAAFRNREVGFVFQFHHLLPDFSALENVMMPGLIQRENRESIQREALRLLGEVGLGDRLHHRPGMLSGGEQQRAAIARALVLKPRLLLADEPTGNLDRKTGTEVFSLMKRINRERGTTFIIVTHNEQLAAETDRALHVIDGQVTPSSIGTKQSSSSA